VRATLAVLVFLVGCGPDLADDLVVEGEASSSTSIGESTDDGVTSTSAGESTDSTTGEPAGRGDESSESGSSSDSTGSASTGETCDETKPHLDEAPCLDACDVCEQLVDGAWYCIC
jgi:hypothetical protein